MNRAGRGPTKLISPTKTFHSWGSSSNFDLRKKLPKDVIELALAKCVATEGAFTCIERNFIRRNGCLPFPTRSCLKMGEPVPKYPIISNTIKIGLRITKPKNENRILVYINTIVINPVDYDIEEIHNGINVKFIRTKIDCIFF